MKHLSDKDSFAIAKLISRFRGVVTWEDIIDLGQEVTGLRYSRQSLESKDDIRTAYDLVNGKDNNLRGGRHSKKPKSKELMAAEDRIAGLEAKCEMVEAVNSKLLEQFIVWAENARKKGLSEADLNKGLSKIDRKSNRKDERSGDEKGKQRENGWKRKRQEAKGMA